MTHTLHRVGTVDNLADDFIFVMLPSKGINDKDGDPRLQKMLKIALKHNPNNIGSDSSGEGGWFTHTTEQILNGCHGEAHAVFSDPNDVVEYLKDLKKANIGISVVVSGLTETVNEICKQAGLTRHTVNYSLGFKGKTNKLPPWEILELTTMCGHHMIGPNLVTTLVGDVKKGRKTAADAAKELAKPCYCGCFNIVRAEKLIAQLAGLKS